MSRIVVALATSILLALIVIGVRPVPVAEVARNESADIGKATQLHLVETYGMLPLIFESNAGQTDSQVKFVSRGQGYTLFLTERAEAVLALRKSALKHNSAQRADRLSAVVNPQREAIPPAVLRIKLAGANPAPQVEGFDEFPGKANYFIGNDPKKWRTNVPLYAKVKVRAIYPGVDLVYHGNQRQLEQDFVLAPGVDPCSITMIAQGAERLSLDPQGDLVVTTKEGEVRFHKPFAYQELNGSRREIPTTYMLKSGGKAGFQVATYDEKRSLIIDPVLSYSTYLGGNGSDEGIGIAADSAGNAYITGQTGSTNFPTSAGAFQTSFAGLAPNDAFVTKLNSSGSLAYSTYLGGSNTEFGFAIAVDSNGDAYVTGETNSSDFPTTVGAFQTVLPGRDNAFVTKLNPSGSALVYSTYVGGSAFDFGFGIAVDSGGNAYITGQTQSTNYPTTAGAFQVSSPGGTAHAFVTKLNSTGSALVYSTYLAGSILDQGNGIQVDSHGNAYVVGYSKSIDFPVTAGAFQTAQGGGTNAFVTKLNNAGSALVYSTYFGGNNEEIGNGIAIDSSGNAYITGVSDSNNLPTTTGAFQTTAPGNIDAFVAKLNASGSALVYSTYLGGSLADEARGIAVDSSGNAYVVGDTSSTNFPTANPVQATLAGSVDAFVTALNPSGTSPLYSSYLGGSGGEIAFGIAVDASASVYVTGQTNSADFPTTPGAFQTSAQGFEDGFVTKIANIVCTQKEDDDDRDDHERHLERDDHQRHNDRHKAKSHPCKGSDEMESEKRDSEKE